MKILSDFPAIKWYTIPKGKKEKPMKAYIFQKEERGWRFPVLALMFLLALCLLDKEAVRAAKVPAGTEAAPDKTQDTENGNSVKKKSNITSRVLQGKDDFATDIRFGMEGLVFYDSAAEMKIALTSREDFSGRLRIVPVAEEYSDQKIAAWGEQITLAKDNTKEFSYTIRTAGASGTFYLQLLNEKGRVVYEERMVVTYANSGTQALTGILSQDYSGLTYFDGLKVYMEGSNTLTNTVELTEKTFPENAEVLENLQILLIDNYDTANLSEKQYAALKEWVRQGGVLILGLGPNYQNVLHCFTDEFLTGSFGELSKKEITLYDGASLSGVDVLSLQVDDAAEMPVYVTEGLAYRKYVGEGSVILLGFDFAMEPLAGYENRKEAVQLLLEQIQVQSSNYQDTNSYWMEEALGTVATGKKPSAFLFLFLFVLYAVVGGPILYLILKKMQKREKIWIAIPVTALVFTGVVYVVGLTYRVSKPIISAIAVIQLQGESVSESVYAQITCPKKREYDIKLEEGYNNIRTTDDYYYSEQRKKPGEYDILMEQRAKGTDLKINSQSPFDASSFILDRTAENSFGEMLLDIHCYTDGFQGTITNNTAYNWKDTVVVFEDYLCFLGDVKKNETVTIDKGSLISSASSWDAIELLFTRKYGWDKLYRDRELYASYRITSFMQSLYGQESNGQGAVWARMEGYVPEVSADSDSKTYGEGILCRTFSGKYEDVAGNYIRNIQEIAVVREGECYEEDGSMYAYTDTVCSYYLDPSLHISRLIIRRFDNDPEGNYWDKEMEAKVYALNPETGEFDPVFVDSEELAGEELSRYLTDGVLILQYDIDDDYKYGELPSISARGEE